MLVTWNLHRSFGQVLGGVNHFHTKSWPGLLGWPFPGGLGQGPVTGHVRVPAAFGKPGRGVHRLGRSDDLPGTMVAFDSRILDLGI